LPGSTVNASTLEFSRLGNMWVVDGATAAVFIVPAESRTLVADQPH